MVLRRWESIAGNFYPLRWLIYVFNSVVNTKLPVQGYTLLYRVIHSYTGLSSAIQYVTHVYGFVRTRVGKTGSSTRSCRAESLRSSPRGILLPFNLAKWFRPVSDIWRFRNVPSDSRRFCPISDASVGI